LLILGGGGSGSGGGKGFVFLLFAVRLFINNLI